MCLLLETIKINQGEVCGLAYHNQRAARARRNLFGLDDGLDLGASIDARAAGVDAVVKCRILYGRRVERVEYQPYQTPVIRSLQLVRDDDIDYRYKFADRSALERLRRRRGPCDEVLIVRRGLVTDTSFTNVVFFDGARYITPAAPLLAGTRRAALLEAGRIEEGEIRPAQLRDFRRVFLINSLLDLEDDISLPVDRIDPVPD